MTIRWLPPMMRPVALVLAVLAMTACAASGAGPGTGTGTSQAPSDPVSARGSEPGIAPVPTSPSPPLTLYVSNQSFEDPNVRISIAIDGVVVADQRFAVEGQHNWVEFEPDVPPGDHTLTATSNTGAELSVEFTTTAGQPRWAAVAYWWYPQDGPRRFTFEITDEPIGFE
jgi:hypothetical protein